MRSINAGKNLREDRFNLTTPLFAFWEVLKEMASTNEVDKEDYTKKDFANMLGATEVGNAEEIADMLSKPLQIEKDMQEIRTKKVNDTIRVAKREEKPRVISAEFNKKMPEFNKEEDNERDL